MTDVGPLKEEDFTEEEAAEKLKELGFNVIHVDELAMVGYSIEYHKGQWGVYEVNEIRDTHERIIRPMSGHLPSFHACVVWLVDNSSKEIRNLASQ